MVFFLALFFPSDTSNSLCEASGLGERMVMEVEAMARRLVATVVLNLTVNAVVVVVVCQWG